jgi:hypothetical protein
MTLVKRNVMYNIYLESVYKNGYTNDTQKHVYG